MTVQAAAGGESSGVTNEQRVLRRIGALRVLPLATIQPARTEAIGRTLVREGLPCIEIALRTPDAVEAVARASQVEGLLVGAGTVLRPEQAQAAAIAGAAFAVAPGLSQDVVECCREIGLPFFPGVATPTEIERARRFGLRTVKVFPIGSLGGASFLRAVSAVYPDVHFIPTGGINLENLRDYLTLPYVLACGGSWLISQSDSENDTRIADVAIRVRQTMELTR